MTPSRDWIDINWADAAPADVSRWIAVLPLAATEQHGPHLPLETDVLIADAYLARVRALLPASVPASFLPVEPIGISTEHIDYPGTQTLPTETALKRWTGIGAEVARRGVRKLVIITSHGGNSAAMMLVAQDLRAHHKMFVVTTSWSRLSGADKLFAPEEVRHGIHGGAVETSIMLARYPGQVRTDAIADFPASSIAMEQQYRWLSTQRPAPFAWQAQDLNASGAVGNATQALPEKGEQLIDQGARAFCELLGEVDNFDVNRLAKGPLG
ncbi:creatininase family protein [Bradyrhizobium sp. KB893862 SZCCT0404]|uniref:creatininase family protein n=1 Tax=Bradyrhizobium sp. KB893862 SZCCT0404 TaxID=2807672 RepID=UPI001BA92044|nr:creatininase family protein [Bradyrhizobium sp. KB893862 SZCCT0404]MBR1179102.1 creatininase family protein [Bradyrhizobium sp. KB893862 SZCCT0404]